MQRDAAKHALGLARFRPVGSAHLGQHDRWVDTVYTNVMRSKFQCHDLCHDVKRSLRPSVHDVVFQCCLWCLYLIYRTSITATLVYFELWQTLNCLYPVQMSVKIIWGLTWEETWTTEPPAPLWIIFLATTWLTFRMDLTLILNCLWEKIILKWQQFNLVAK